MGIDVVKLSSSAKDDLLSKKKKDKTSFNAFWIVGLGIAVNHVIAIISLMYFRNIGWQFVAAALVSGFLNMMGITAGYHRLWSHNAYVASAPLKYLLATLGAASWQGSIHWWVIRHRMHHRFVDTMYDPYDSTRGLWFSHFGWLFERPRFYDKSSIINMSDVLNDPVCRWNRHYTPHLVIILGIVLPALVGWMMGDALAGFVCIGVWGRIISWNGIFAVNSFGHHDGVGGKDYAYHSSATSSLLFALASNGEGNHNYHHEFPHDYRHGVKWSDYDPTKWFIWMCYFLGFASDLVTVEDHVREESEKEVKVMRARKALDATMSGYARHMGEPTGSLPAPLAHALLPSISSRDINNAEAIRKVVPSTDKTPLVMRIDDYLVEVTHFAKDHPGSEALIKGMVGKDATEMFWRGRNMHTKAAHNIVKRLRVAKVIDEDPKQDCKKKK